MEKAFLHNNSLLDWKETGAYIADSEDFDLAKYGYTQQDVLGIAYLKHLRDQVVVNDFSLIASFDGRHRSGKSVTVATISCLIDPTFWDNFNSRIVTTPDQFLRVIKSFGDNDIHGGVIQIDEAGITLSGADFYERWMKNVVDAVQMFGYLNPIVFFVAPIKDFINAPLRKMFHIYFNVRRYSDGCAYVIPYHLNYSGTYSKTFYRKPVVRFAGRKFHLRKLKMPKPPDFIVKRYKELEKLNKSRILEGLVKNMGYLQTRDTSRKLSEDEILECILNTPELYEAKSSKPEDLKLSGDWVHHRHKHVPVRTCSLLAQDAERIIKEKRVDLKAKAEEDVK